SARAASRADPAARASPSMPRSSCSATTLPIAPNPAIATRFSIFASPRTAPSIRFRQPQHALADMRQDQLRHHRRDAGDLGFAEIALDVEFLGVAHPAMGQHRGLASAGASFACKILGGVGKGPRLLALVIGGGG